MFFSGTPSGYNKMLHEEGLHHDNVMFNNPDLTLAGNAVDGYVNQSDFERVTISSSSWLEAGGGQAPGVGSPTGNFNDASFNPHVENDGTEFRSLSFNIDANGNEKGNVAVTLYDDAGERMNDQPHT